MVLGNGWPDSKQIAQSNSEQGLFTGGQYGIDVGTHPLCNMRLDTKGVKT